MNPSRSRTQASSSHADGPDDAEQIARSVLGAAWKAAGFEPRHVDVVWVAPMRADELSTNRFLEQARDPLNGERYELAIVAAQIHFEMQVRLLMERAAKRNGETWAKRLIKNSRAAMLANDVSKATAELLLQIDVTKQSFWPAYTVHLARRNAVVHEGKTMGKQEAQESINTVESMWAELAKVERPSTLL